MVEIKFWTFFLFLVLLILVTLGFCQLTSGFIAIHKAQMEFQWALSALRVGRIRRCGLSALPNTNFQKESLKKLGRFGRFLFGRLGGFDPDCWVHVRMSIRSMVLPSMDPGMFFVFLGKPGNLEKLPAIQPFPTFVSFSHLVVKLQPGRGEISMITSVKL